MSRRAVAAWLFALSRHRAVAPVVRWGFTHLAPVLPLRRVAQTASVIAFHHPRPHWSTHVLLVPRVSVPNLLALDARTLPAFHDLLCLAWRLSADLTPGSKEAMALIVNGGPYQEVGQLHAHLAVGPTAPHVLCPSTALPPVLTRTRPELVVMPHPAPVRQTHLVLLPAPPVATDASDAAERERVGAIVAMIQRLVRERDLEQAGYSLIVGATGDGLDFSCLHLVAGPRRAGE